MFHISYWNFVIGGIGVFLSVIFSPKTLLSNYGKTSHFESKEMHYLGMALVLIILPELVQVMMKCCSQYFFKNSSGILVGRAVYAIATFLLGLHLSLQSMYFVGESLIILNCYRIIYISTISFFLSYTHSSTENVYLVMAINILSCSLMCYSNLLAKDQDGSNSSYVLVLLFAMSLYYICRKCFKIWFKKNAFSYSHILFIYFSLMAIAFAITLRVVIFLYYQEYSKYAPILIYVFQSINFAVIPGLIAEQDVIQSKDYLATTKSAFQRYIFHEMKSPLNSTIMGIQHCLSLINEDTTVPADMLDMRDTLMDTQNSTNDALQIMEDMLLFDKFENGKVVLHKEKRVPVKDLILDCVNMFKFQIKSKGINCRMFNCCIKTDSNIEVFPTTTTTTTTDSQPMNAIATDFTNVFTSEAPVGVCVSDFVKDSDTINVDKAKWCQVYGNVLSNAIKFTPKDGTVTLRAFYVLNEISKCQNDNSTFNHFFYKMFSYSYHAAAIKNIIATVTKTSIIVDKNQSQITNHNNAVEKKPVPTGMLVVEIQDSGAGISIENQARLFKEIVQFNPHKLQAGGGSGLGMCISKGIVDMHGGKISVHSEGEGKGTTFRIEIPMTRDPNAKVCKETIKLSTQSTVSTEIKIRQELPDLIDKRKVIVVDNLDSNREMSRKWKSLTNLSTALTSIPNTTAALSTKATISTEINLSKEIPPIVDKKRILIVDDVDSNRKMLKKLLSKRGHECDEADDGTVAVAAIKAIITAKEANYENTLPIKPYDVIFMDYMMCDMNGPEATRLIRALGFKGLIIGATGNSLDDDQVFFMNAGLDDIIIKPLRMPEIVQKVRL